MTSPARPKSRQSMNPAVGLIERNLNAEKIKGKKRAVMSMGGKPSGEDTLSPKSLARRAAKPRKSILKAFPIPNFGGHNENTNTNINQTEDETIETTRDLEIHTIQFGGGRPSIGRRVAFAPSAHVRMFEKPTTTSQRRSSIAPPAPSIPGQPNTFTLPPPNTQPGPSRPSTGHGRRSSIQNIAAVVDVGEGSMDMSMEDYSDNMIARPHSNDNDVETDEDEEDMSMEMTQSYGGGIIHQQQHQNQEEDESFMTETSTRSDGETMEFTVAVGGFLPPVAPTSATRGRASLGYTHLDPSGSAALVPGEGEEEDDMEMDETVAFGGIINNHNGIGGDDTISTNASDDTINGVQGRERTMTFNFGDINTAARQEQSEMGVDVDVDVDVEFDMDMTTVGGGIHTQQHSHLHAHATIHTQPSGNIFAQSTNQNQPRPSSQQNIFAQSQSQSQTPKSPHRQTLTKPSSSTPSFARPTASSAQKSVSLPLSSSTSKSPEKQKEKRNIYGPSPSPAKSLSTTPRKSGMGIAGEVAKRLSFGSVTSGSSVHGSVKRSRTVEQEGEEEEEEEMVKRQKSLGDSIFGRPRLSAPVAEQPLAHGSTPRKSLAPDISRGTPRKSMVLQSQSPARPTPRQSIGKSPRKSMIPLITLPEPELENEEDEQVEAELLQEEEDKELEEEEVQLEEQIEAPPIGLASFLQMAGVEFEDTLPILSRRKSGLRIEGSRDRVFQPCDYTEAKIESIYLHTYNWATNKVHSQLREDTSALQALTTLYNTHNPRVIAEYLEATPEDRETFEGIFRAYKELMSLQARGRWYEWKRGLVERLGPDIEGILHEVQEDEIKLDEMTSQLDGYLPLLRERAAALEIELGKEKEVVAEIEKCDQGELSDWRATVLDTKKALDDQNSETTETISKLNDLRSKLGEYEIQIAEHTNAIRDARGRCDEFTRGDVGRLQREYETLQELHQWTINHLRADQLSLTYSSELKLVFNCNAFVPDITSASISLLSPGKGATGGLMALLEGQLALIVKGKKLNLSTIVQKIGSIWNSAQRLRSELILLNQQYPTTFSTINSTSNSKTKSLKCSTTILLPFKKAKIVLEYTLGGEVLSNWPGGLGGVGTDVKVIYGDELDLSLLKMAAEETIATVQEDGYVGILLNVARDVAQQYAP